MSLTKLNNASATKLQQSSSPNTLQQINNPSALISLTTASNSSSSAPNNNHAPHQTKSGGESSDGAHPLLQKYSKDLIVTTKPPLPSSATLLLHRPPSRYSMSQRNSNWSNSMTPRMRVPLSDTYPLPMMGAPNTSRPASPLTRSYQNGSPTASMNSIQVKHHHLQSESSFGEGSSTGSSLSKFKYNGPHQVYGGPEAASAEGPAPLRWPLTQSTKHFIEPPPPPPEILRDMQMLNKHTSSTTRTSAYPLPITVNETLAPPVQPILPSNNLKNAEQESLLNTMLEATRDMDPTSFGSQQGSLLLTSPPTGSSPSFPSTQLLAQMEQASVRSPSGTINKVAGPFANTGIPSDIQDDLLRIEMLLEFRKFKEALNQKIQNQNHLIQLVNSVNSKSQLNSQRQHPLQQQFDSHFPQSHLPPHLPVQQPQTSHHQWHPTLSTLMDSPTNSGSKESGGGGGVGEHTPDLSEEKPVWKLEDITETFNSPNFIIQTFMEPYHVLSSGSANQNTRQQQQRATVSDGMNANNAKSVSLLQSGRKLDEFQALQDQSQSGFPSELLQQQNPLLAGANQYHASRSQQLFSVMSEKLTNSNETTAAPPEVTKTTPLRIQVTPKESSHQQQRVQSSVQQQYQRYLLDRSFQSLSPNSFKVLDSIKRDPNVIMRKPVAVALKTNNDDRTAPHNFSPDGSSTPTGTMLSHRDGSAFNQWDRPSPYFPGFSASPIDIKIRSPEEQSRRMANQGDETREVSTSHLEGVEELGNLLSQLPVLTRKEKVEEFQAFNTLMPVSPVTEVESETSMIPLVSSTGTLVSDKIRPDTVETKPSNRALEEAEEEWRNVDPNKLNINELVTLGRKIYRILSQLSTTPANAQLNMSHHQVVTAPMTLNVPSPNTPIFTTSNSNTKKTLSLNPLGLTSPQVVVDFNAIPNPTFVTGPSPTSKISSKSKQNVVATSDSRSRTPIKPPHLFRKLLHPPPTRWSGTARQKSTAVSNPPSFVTPKHSQTHQVQQKQQSSSFNNRKSTSSPGRNGGSGTRHTAAGLETKPSIKLTPPPPVILVESTTKLPETFTVRERYNNNNGPRSMSKYKHRRQSTPYPFSSLGVAGGTDSNMNTTNRSNTSAAPSRGRSLGRRNFIQENISRLKTMKKLPDSRVRPRRLPPVNKKRYENIPSTIPGSRSRSPSNTREGNYRHQSFYEEYRRSSSVPASTTGGRGGGGRGFYSPSRNYPNRSISTPRPSTGMSVHVVSSRSRSSTQIRPTSRNRPMSQASQGIIAKPVLFQGSSKGARAIANKNSFLQTPTTKAKSTGSKVKFGRLPSKTSIGKADSVRGAGSRSSLALGRKSRSKTKKISNQKSKNSAAFKNSSVSSTDRPSPPPPPPKQKKTVKGKTNKEAKGQKTRKAKKSAIAEAASMPEMSDAEEVTGDTTEGSGKGTTGIFNSESEQRMIRDMVMAEMNLMVQQQVKKALLQEQSSTSRSRGSSRQQHVKIDETTLLEQQQTKHDYDEEVDEGGDTEGDHHRPNDPDYHEEEEEYSDGKYTDNVSYDQDDTPGIDSDNITPVYSPPKYYDESLFSLEKWLNPDRTAPGSAYTSAKETPVTTANNNENSVYGIVGGGVKKLRAASKPQTVRFSLPKMSK